MIKKMSINAAVTVLLCAFMFSSCEDKKTVEAPSVTTITDAWIRPSVGPNSAGFGIITPEADTSLVGVEVVGDPISQSIELHTHTKEGDVMKMQAVPHFDLKKGVPFELKCGGNHVMFMKINHEIKEGDKPVKLRFKFKNTDNTEKNIETEAVIKKKPCAHHD